VDGGDERVVVDLASGKRVPFGFRLYNNSAGEANLTEEAITSDELTTRDRLTAADELTPGWRFAPGVFAWANRVLASACPCDLLVIDEVGPLELEGNRGWVQALAAVTSGRFGVALVVCRPQLVARLRARLGGIAVGVREVTVVSRNDLVRDLLAEITTRLSEVSRRG
jgi:hypothetical protein